MTLMTDDEGDHRQDHAEKGEEAAQLVGAHRVQGELEGFREGAPSTTVPLPAGQFPRHERALRL